MILIIPILLLLVNLSFSSIFIDCPDDIVGYNNFDTDTQLCFNTRSFITYNPIYRLRLIKTTNPTEQRIVFLQDLIL